MYVGEKYVYIYTLYTYTYVKENMYIYMYTIVNMYIYIYMYMYMYTYVYACGPKTVPVKRTFLNIAIVGWGGGGMLTFFVLHT